MTDITLTVRRAIVQLKIGDQTTIKHPSATAEAITAEATRFGKARRMALQIEPMDGAIKVTRLAETPRVNLYPELDALEVGASHLFNLPPAMHQRIRLAASSRSRSGMVRLSCSREGDAIRVTRLPMTEDEAASCPQLSMTERSTKYGLERLSTESQLRFEISRLDQAKLRLAAHRMSIKTGWMIRCRLQDDGSMLVYRTDQAVLAK